MSAAPRISPTLLRRLKALSKKEMSFAEINRVLGAQAETLGVPRPSYQQVRMIVREFRRSAGTATVTSLLVDHAFGVRSPQEVAVALATGERRPIPSPQRRAK